MIVELFTLWWSHKAVTKMDAEQPQQQQRDRDMFVPFEGENPFENGGPHEKQSQNTQNQNNQQGDQEYNYYPDDFDDFGDGGNGF